MLSPNILNDPLDVEVARRSLYDFIRLGAWDVLEPGTPYVDGWHIRVVCDAIQEVLEDWAHPNTGVIPDKIKRTAQNTVVNIPPGTMKSLIVSVFAPAWMWVRFPHWRAIYSSANPRVALRDSVKCRDLIDSDWYQKSFRPTWQLADDQNAKGYYKNTEGGFRQAVSVGQKITGDRADFLGVDDPLDAMDADSNSKTARDACLYWWDNAFCNRVNDLQRSKRFIIMQRLHEDDLSGHLLKQASTAHLILPMEFDPERADPRDPRTLPGELLFPARFPESVLVEERRRLGTWGYSGQMQQAPVPAGGGMFPFGWWRFWSRMSTTVAGPRPEGCTSLPPRRLPAHFSSLTMSVDATFKEAATSDFVVITVWGRERADSFLLHVFRERAGLNNTIKAMREIYKAFPDIHRILVEDKANGTAVIETLKSEWSGIVPIEPSGGKDARAAACQPEIESGNVYLPEGAPWLAAFLEEFGKFPKGSHDDQVDSVSQYLNYERHSGFRKLEALCGVV